MTITQELLRELTHCWYITNIFFLSDHLGTLRQLFIVKIVHKLIRFLGMRLYPLLRPITSSSFFITYVLSKIFKFSYPAPESISVDYHYLLNPHCKSPHFKSSSLSLQPFPLLVFLLRKMVCILSLLIYLHSFPAGVHQSYIVCF